MQTRTLSIEHDNEKIIIKLNLVLYIHICILVFKMIGLKSQNCLALTLFRNFRKRVSFILFCLTTVEYIYVYTIKKKNSLYLLISTNDFQ